MTADAFDVFDLALKSIERDEKLLTTMYAHVKRLDAEMAELRDELLALSNRIEAVTRALPNPNLRLSTAHSVKVTP